MLPSKSLSISFEITVSDMGHGGTLPSDGQGHNPFCEQAKYERGETAVHYLWNTPETDENLLLEFGTNLEKKNLWRQITVAPDRLEELKAKVKCDGIQPQCGPVGALSSHTERY